MKVLVAGASVLTEQAPFGRPAGNRCDPHVAAMRSTEQQAFTAPEGMALRYGLLYGGDSERLRALLARRGVPVARGGVLGTSMHVSNAKAKAKAGWRPAFPTYHEGIQAMVSPPQRVA